MATLQVKRVPDELHARLRQRAAAQGVTLSDLVLETLRQSLELPSQREWLDALADDPPVHGLDSVAAVQAAREERLEQLERTARRA